MTTVSAKLERYMDLLSARQKLVASNLANIDTPGYKTKDIDFHFEFMSRVEGGSGTNAPPAGSIRNLLGLAADDSKPNVIEPDLPSKNDGNNVSLDRETRLLAENAMRFQTASLLARGQIRMIRTAIQEGKNG